MRKFLYQRVEKRSICRHADAEICLGHLIITLSHGNTLLCTNWLDKQLFGIKWHLSQS